MPIRRDVWYSVDGKTRYSLMVTHRNWRKLAVDAAEDYHGNHDGWEAPWPLDILLFESEDGPPVAKFEVEREVVPQFHAWERPVSVDAVDPVGGSDHGLSTRDKASS